VSARPWEEDDEQPERTSLTALGKRVRNLREGRRMTQEAFALRAGISVSFASLLERGERSPSYDTLLAVARALEVPVSDLFREGPAVEAQDPSHLRLLEFARRAHLSRAQVERYVAVGHAMFGLEPESGSRVGRPQRCSVDGCDRPVLAKGMCAPHYHRARRARLQR
jgi:transcriptional regulator with XRE-family HTH domain